MSHVRLFPINSQGVAHTVVNRILDDPRPADVQEWEAASGRSFEDALRESLLGNHAGHSWAAFRGVNEVLMAFGVNPYGSLRAGIAWLVATNAAVRHIHALHAHFKEGLGQMLAVRPELHAWADERNTLHHEWMLRMGFERTERQLYFNDAAVPFRLFVITKKD